MNHLPSTRHDWVRHVCVAHVILVLCLPMGHYQTPDVTDRVIDAVRRAV